MARLLPLLEFLRQAIALELFITSHTAKALLQLYHQHLLQLHQMATYYSSTKTNHLSATGILAGMAASTTRAPAQRPGNPEPPSRVFNPYDINVMSAARAAGCDSDSSDGGRDRWGIGGSSSDEDGLWRVPRTHNRTAERRAARLHAAANGSRSDSPFSVGPVASTPTVGHGKWSSTSKEYSAALQ